MTSPHTLPIANQRFLHKDVAPQKSDMMRHSHWPPLACRVPVQSKCLLLHDPFISATPPRAHTNPLPHTLLTNALLSWGTALQGLSNCCFAIFAAHMFLAILPDETPDQQASKVLQDTLARRRGKGAGRGKEGRPSDRAHRSTGTIYMSSQIPAPPADISGLRSLR